jgi:hypothetical protein
MFAREDRYGNSFTPEYAARRIEMEPLAEIIQHKGTSECLISGNDEQCEFDMVPWGHLAGNVELSILPEVEPKESSFLRDALKEGLAYEQDIGENPFKFGLIGSTDSHIGAPGLVEEKDYPGHGGAGNLGEVAEIDITVFNDNPEHNPGGLAVVWAEQNTRKDLFAAMKRKEVYATSGPRHVLRFFAGYDYDADLCENSANLVETGYRQGVPMGGDLVSRSDKKPQFIVSALKDPGTINAPGVDLQKVQIIKGWLDSEGVRQEQVVEVVGDADNGASVNEATCETIGAGRSHLCTVWEDADFNPNQHAFYYARVLENPSCRWPTYQCIQAGVDCSDAASIPEGMLACCSEDLPKTHQERSWSSPIWHTPQS